MAGRTRSGATAFEDYRLRLDATSRRCPDCGHVDAESGWRAETTGSRVTYRHVCPACGAVDRVEIHLRA
jgi:rubredoxin